MLNRAGGTARLELRRQELAAKGKASGFVDDDDLMMERGGWCGV